MPNLYASLGMLKSALNKTTTTDDTELLRELDRVSREIDNFTGRQFYAETATRYFGGRGRVSLRVDDLISVSSLTVDDNGDDTYEITLAVTTDYFLEPDNPIQNTPYSHIRLNPNSSLLGAWPRGPRAVKVTGVFVSPPVSP